MKCLKFLHKHCLSCDLLSHDYLASIHIKEQTLARLFPEHLHKMKTSVICEKGADGTRNKAKLAVARIQGRIEFGFYDQYKQFKKLEDCPLHVPSINAILPALKKTLTTHKISPYDLQSKKGELKYLLITYSESANEILLRFVLRSKNLVSTFQSLAHELTTHHPDIKVITANIQPIHQAILEGDEEIVLTSQDYITHYFEGHVLFQGPRSFFQTNTAMALELYRQFQKELSILNIHSFLDLYCGVGAFSLFARKYCSRVIGVEISETAISYANQARKINQLTDIQFLAMDVQDFLISQKPDAFDAIMVNPPRRGLNALIIAHLIRLAPKYLFYSSCNAATLQRDILDLEGQYQIQSIQMFDMFPFTSHFETLVVLCKST